MKKYTPAIAKKFRLIAVAAEESRGSRNNRTLSAGYSVLDSCPQKSATTTRSAAMGPRTRRCFQDEASPPLIMPYTSSTASRLTINTKSTTHLRRSEIICDVRPSDQGQYVSIRNEIVS